MPLDPGAPNPAVVSYHITQRPVARPSGFPSRRIPVPGTLRSLGSLGSGGLGSIIAFSSREKECFGRLF